MPLATRQALTIYFAANLALIFALALPAAGMLNHLLSGSDSLERGFLIWLSLIVLCWLATIPIIPIARRRRIQISEKQDTG